MNDLETRQLRYFVAVAEELHFGRAAERLGMAQPPLSRAIRLLERQLGVALLERTTRQVTLTAAGEVLLRDARNVLAAVTAASRRARQAGRTAPRLRVALKADIDGGLLPRILIAYAAEGALGAVPPAELVLGSLGEQAPALRDGRADVALLISPFDDHGLEAEPLLTEPLLVALAATDPLAGHPQLCLADLGGRKLPGGSLARHGWPAARLGPGAALDPGAAPGPGAARGPGPARDGQPDRAAGRDPRDGAARTGHNLAEIFSLVETGSIVFFLPESLARRYPRPGVAYQPVTDLRPATLFVAWPQDAHSPAVAAFVRAACSVAATVQAETAPQHVAS